MDYQLTNWVLSEGELRGHMASLRKYKTPYELKERVEGNTTWYAVFIHDPKHKETGEE